ncbi:MAG: hypothetical protein JWN98_1147, partial [Abditibacteriota bacterium]|nr:hypothetical protein [Abditibacteriota bacterium]
MFFFAPQRGVLQPAHKLHVLPSQRFWLRSLLGLGAVVGVGQLANLLVPALAAPPRFVPAKAAPPAKSAAKTAPKPALKSASASASAATKNKSIDFVSQVQPIFVTNCYPCHSAQKVRGKLRLDAKALAMAGGLSGVAIVPGNSEKSYLVQRILGAGDEARMPLGHNPLTPAQIQTIRAWIDGGAVWPQSASVEVKPQKHWAYIKPTQHKPPVVRDKAWVRNPIDNFVLARLEKEGLKPSPPAERATLIRRVSLDLTGLPPTIEEVDAFLADKSPDAYDKVVTRLLASPRYGERWGRHWLDIARYADTNGYEKDRARTIWPYRDWVINAINNDMPFDQFAIEQVAGDMLPNATLAQRVATGFHRNTMINEEGGIDVEEFRQKAVVDRVETTATAFLGVTLQCANCHNHKYDEFSHKEYYQFTALLNNADEPEIEVPTPEVSARRAVLEAQIEKIRAGLENDFPLSEEAYAWEALKPLKATAASGATLQVQGDHALLASGPVPATETYAVTFNTDLKEIGALRLEALTDAALPQKGPGRSGAMGNGNFVLSEIKVTAAPVASGTAKAVVLSGAQADFSQQSFGVASAIDGDAKTGWAIAGPGNFNQNRVATFTLKDKLGFEGGTLLTVTLDQQYAQHMLGKFRISAGRQAQAPIVQSEQDAARKRSQFLAAKMAEWEKQVAAKSATWIPLEPLKFSRNYGATITKLDDRSLLFTGDNLYRDEYKLEFASDLKTITGMRLEVLPHPELPNGGPGRNPDGGFLLSEFAVAAGALNRADALAPVELQSAVADFGSSPQQAIDGKKDTHWTVPGDAQPHAIVFRFNETIANEAGSRFALSLLQNYHQQENIGRLRVWVTGHQSTLEASGLPAEIESIVVTPAAQRTAQQQAQLKQHFLETTPLLNERQQQIAALRTAMPRYQTTLAMTERAVPRVTQIHKRGEFFNLGDEVSPGVPAALHPLSAS